jgi:hypothetical protein
MKPNYPTIKSLFVLLFILSCFDAVGQGALDDEYGNHYGYNRSPIYYPQDVEDDEDDPGTGEEGGGTVEDPETPIDENLLYLAIAGIAAAGWYKFKVS